MRPIFIYRINNHSSEIKILIINVHVTRIRSVKLVQCQWLRSIHVALVHVCIYTNATI